MKNESGIDIAYCALDGAYLVGEYAPKNDSGEMKETWTVLGARQKEMEL